MHAPKPDADWSACVSTYEPGLRRFFRRRVSEAEIDDLVQDVFVRLQSAKNGAAIENVEGYLFAIARNVLISQYRRNGTRQTEWHAGFEAADPLSPERIAIGRDEYLRVMNAIKRLPPRAREAFQLHRFEHLTYAAIAVRMGISKESVKELMHRAIVRISEANEVEA